MTSETKQEIVKKLQQRLGFLGIVVDDIRFDFDKETLKHFNVSTNEELMSTVIADSEIEKLIDNVERDVLLSYFKNKYPGVMPATRDCEREFQQNPCEKTLKALKKQRLGQWKTLFDETRRNKTNGFDVPFSEEDWKIMEKLLNLSFDVTFWHIKMIGLSIKKVEEVGIATMRFNDDVALFERDLQEYEDKFNEFQKTSQNIDEFEEKMDEYLKDYCERNDKRSLEDIDKYIQQCKKEIEKAIASNKTVFQKEQSLWEGFDAAQQKLNEYKAQVNGTKVVKYFGSLTKPLCDVQSVQKEHKQAEQEKIVFEQIDRNFQKTCSRQLSAKQKLKTINEKIINYKKVSRAPDHK